LLLPPIGRAAWVGLFATSLNLIPVAQLDGGHILRSVNPWLHRRASMFLPLLLFLVGISGFWSARLWNVWSFWGVLLLLMSFLRVAPIHDPTTLDSKRLWGALLTLLVFLLCFMPAPFFIPPSSP
jgi:membrane-associated protease RseP (regulator of RpoE activity)